MPSLFCIFDIKLSLMKARYLFTALILLITCYVQSQNVTDAAGKKQGPWVKRYPNGKIMYEGTFTDDKPAGLFKRYYEDGTLQSELTYNDKTGNAAAVFFYPEGTRAAEGIYVAHKKEGLWKFYSEMKPSYLICEEYYHNDLRHGASRKFYPDSTLAEIVTWDSGGRTGEWLQYYPDGTISLRAEYLEGKLNGPFSFYHPNGKPQYEGKYKDDFRYGDWMVFNEDGSLKQILEYRDGKLVNPDQAEKETKFLDDLEKNKGKIEIHDITGGVIR
jgi:antitoxin component YwqK of YwqJK toxin-antitoxin module